MPLRSSNDYQVDYEIRPHYLFFHIKLTVNDYNVARQYWTEILRVIHSRRSARNVVAITTEHALPPGDAHSLMNDFSRFMYPGIKVAIVNHRVVPAVRLAVESAAKSKGRQLKIVDDVAAAESWLSEPQSSFAPKTLGSDLSDLTRIDTLQ